MDAQIEKRMTDPVILHHCTGTKDGDSMFAEPTTIYGYVAPKQIIVITRDGVEVKTQSSVLLNGSYATQIGAQDELEVELAGRTTIKKLNGYKNPKGEYELLEVLL
jgi:hypothetical protein